MLNYWSIYYWTRYQAFFALTRISARICLWLEFSCDMQYNDQLFHAITHQLLNFLLPQLVKNAYELNVRYAVGKECFSCQLHFYFCEQEMGNCSDDAPRTSERNVGVNKNTILENVASIKIWTIDVVFFFEFLLLSIIFTLYMHY